VKNGRRCSEEGKGITMKLFSNNKLSKVLLIVTTAIIGIVIIYSMILDAILDQH
jgi:hypothetical protein